MKSTYVTFLILSTIFLFSMANTANAVVTGNFHFRAFIDGADYVYVQNAGGKVWYEHLDYEYPGQHSPYSQSSPAPTTIDGVKWYPVWNTTAKKSNTYVTNSPLNYPDGQWTAVNITKITNTTDTTQSRGPITIIASPSSSNSYTAKILLNDDTGSIIYGGATWYEFQISWQAPVLAPEFSSTIIAAMTVATVSIAVVYARKRIIRPTHF
jgi:hypothetical protein